MKKLLTFLVFLLVLACSISVFADYQTVDIYVNGELLVSDSPAVLVGSRTMVPLRAISEKLGCEVGWDAETQTAEIKNSKTAVYVTIGSDVMVKKAVAEGKSEDIKIDAPAMLYKSRTLIPLRAVSEALDAKVDWDSEKECALITTDSYKSYYGVVTEDGYVSEELGLKFVAPKGTLMSHNTEKVKVSDWTDDVGTVDAQSVTEFNVMFESSGTNLTLAVTPKTSVSTTEYLEYIKNSIQETLAGITVVETQKFKTIEVAGCTFEYVDFATEYEDSVVTIRYCASKIGDRIAVFVIVYENGMEVNVSEILDGMTRL